MTITFLGGAGGVTGSKHLIETDDGKRILFDCGTFQGQIDVRERNKAFPFRPETIDAVVLSHAHIDHCGMLPLLVKRGFAGNIFATPATRDVTELMLDDMAGIEEADAGYREKHRQDAKVTREPLFTRDDIPSVMERFVDVPYVRMGGGWVNVVPGVKVKMYDAGHILGSAISVVEIDTLEGPKRICYSGDVGPKGMPLLFDPQIPKEHIDTLLLESTYGDRAHDEFEKAIERLAQTVTRVCERKGKIIIPAFSLGRTQVLVYLLHHLTDEGRIPRFPIYVDSPLATKISDIYTKHKKSYDAETWEDFTPENTTGNSSDHRPLSFSNLEYTRTRDESMALNSMNGPFAIISASGMMTAGRVVHHLRHTIREKKNAVFVTGYQAQGTTGRKIIEGHKRVDLYGDWFDVNAEIVLFNEFSAHADQRELQQLALDIPGVSQIALVHGESTQADDFKKQLERANSKWRVVRPNEGDAIEV